MNRRQFIATFGLTTAWPLGVHGQRSEMPLVAVLMATAADDADSQDRFQAFLRSLDKAGWTQGRNIRIESRWLAGDPDRARAYPAELLSPPAANISNAVAASPAIVRWRTRIAYTSSSACAASRSLTLGPALLSPATFCGSRSGMALQSASYFPA
jgi:putative ABC transport system substrate-binding protein